MKTLIIAAIALTSVSYASAQATETKASSDTVAVVADAQDKRTPVKLEELPDAVKKSLAGDAYTGWTPTTAFWIEEKISYYEIEMSKGDDKSIVRLDKMGQPIK